MKPINPCIRCDQDTKDFDKERFFCDDCLFWKIMCEVAGDAKREYYRKRYTKSKKHIASKKSVTNIVEDKCSICGNGSNLYGKKGERRALIYGNIIYCNRCKKNLKK